MRTSSLGPLVASLAFMLAGCTATVSGEPPVGETASELGSGGGTAYCAGPSASTCASVSWRGDHVHMDMNSANNGGHTYEKSIVRFGMVGRGDVTQFDVDSSSADIRSGLSAGGLFWFSAEGCFIYGGALWETCSYWGSWSPMQYVYIPDTGTTWYDTDLHTRGPDDGWQAGWEISNGGWRLFEVCSASYQGSSQQVGKYFGGYCHFGYGGAEKLVMGAMVLDTIGAGVGWAWNNTDGAMQTAVAGGWEDGHPLYVCRAPYGGGYHPGKVVGGNCNIAYGGREIPVGGSWQVLTH